MFEKPGKKNNGGNNGESDSNTESSESESVATDNTGARGESGDGKVEK